jgi:DNA polymerase-1
MTASMCSKIPYEKITKPIRYYYKSANWTLIFGGGAETLATEHDIPIEEAKKIIKTYFKQFPEVPVYLKTCQTFGEDHGYIESPFGRREHLQYIQDKQMSSYKAKDIRSAVNMPVQSGASDVLMCAMVIIDKIMEEKQLKSLLVNTVHDSLVVDAHPDEVDEMAELCKNTMNNVKELAKNYMPHVDFRWLVCPLKTDVAIGTHYGTEEDYYEWKQNQLEKVGE